MLLSAGSKAGAGATAGSCASSHLTPLQAPGEEAGSSGSSKHWAAHEHWAVGTDGVFNHA